MHSNIVAFGLLFLSSYVVSETCVTPLGVTSKCISLYDCKQLLQAFQLKPLRNEIVSFLRRSQCGFDGYTPKVCCGDLPQETSTTTNYPLTTKTTILDGKVDPVSQEDSLPAPQDKCGIDSNGDRIYGGEITDLDEFPWMVLLGYRTTENTITHQCGGVLINKRYALTAAHCVVGEIETAVGKLATVRLGEYDTQTEPDCLDGQCADPYQEIPVHSAFAHPGFTDTKKNREDDIAIVRFARRAKYNDYVQPICLVDTRLRLEVGHEVYVAGWGKTLAGNRSPIKLKLRMPIFKKDDCITKYQRFGALLTEKQLCAGGTYAQDACRGDSGGPLMRKRPNGVWESVAIVSFGYGCGRDGWPGVYTSVASYQDWIRETLRSSNV